MTGVTAYSMYGTHMLIWVFATYERSRAVQYQYRWGAEESKMTDKPCAKKASRRLQAKPVILVDDGSLFSASGVHLDSSD